MKKLLNDILFYHELTITHDKRARINDYEIDYYVANFLIMFDIISQDSGNFETGEKHYIINVSSKSETFDGSLSVFDRIICVRHILLNAKTFLYAEVRQQLLEDLDYIELQYSRKYKLKKLNNI